MTSGVLRPYTLVDVLGTLNQQDTTQTGNDAVNGLGDFVETNEAATMTDSATVTHAAAPAWDAATWGTALWS